MRQAFGGLVVEAEVEDGVHHAGHGGARARAHGDEQRIAHVAELLAGAAFERLQRIVDLGFEVGGILRLLA